jgi:thiamine biosynthesis lipoprotein
MKDGAIATSGNYEIYYDNEKLFHHIINSRTGHSPQLSNSVTVVAPTVMDADALATSVFVMEPLTGVQFINNQPDCECFVISKDGDISRSKGWQV